MNKNIKLITFSIALTFHESHRFEARNKKLKVIHNKITEQIESLYEIDDAFYEAIEKISSDWKELYMVPVCDGIVWHLNIKYIDNNEKSIEGFNSYPINLKEVKWKLIK